MQTQNESNAWEPLAKRFEHREYKSGDSIPVRFFGSDGQVTMLFDDTYWSLDDYLSSLRAAGFSSCHHFKPTHPCSEDVVREIQFLQRIGVFPPVPFQDYMGEPTTVIVATKGNRPSSPSATVPETQVPVLPTVLRLE